ncbi:MAG: uncharacterized protein A8A55_3514, partial [Amphiamblys sp. WSBS2006]
MLEEIKEGACSEMALKKILMRARFGKGVDSYEFVWKKKGDTDEGADVVEFGFKEISDENKTRIKDGELDLGKIRYLNLYRNAVELLPMLKIHEDNKMDVLDL